MKTLLVVLLWSAVAFAQAESPPPPPPPPPASSPSEGEAPPAPPPPEANAEAKTPKKYWARGAAYAGFVMAGLAMVTSFGLAGLTACCSAAPPWSLARLLLPSPPSTACRVEVPVTVLLVGRT